MIEHDESEVGSSGCEDCNRPYGDENGFPDLIIPFWAWKQISTHGDDSGLLCPSCICKRLADKGIKCEGAFMSGPIISVSQHAMQLDRRIENIEIALEGRRNRWGVALDDRIAEGGAAPHKNDTTATRLTRKSLLRRAREFTDVARSLGGEAPRNDEGNELPSPAQKPSEKSP